MKKILQLRGKGKIRKAKAVEIMDLEEYGAMDMDSRLALIHDLIPIGLIHVKEELQREVKQLAGDKYKRNGLPGHDRWGKQSAGSFGQGSIYIQDQRIPIAVPEIRDTKNNWEVPLSTYERLQTPTEKAEEKLLRRVS
jgi:hypothetical protein